MKRRPGEVGFVFAIAISAYPRLRCRSGTATQIDILARLQAHVRLPPVGPATAAGAEALTLALDVEHADIVDLDVERSSTARPISCLVASVVTRNTNWPLLSAASVDFSEMTGPSSTFIKRS
jgi:hypothetical protein